MPHLLGLDESSGDFVEMGCCGEDIADIITAGSHDLEASAYTGSYSFTAPARVNSVTFQFSTRAYRVISYTRADGSVFTYPSTSLEVVFEEIEEDFPADSSLTIGITQTEDSCLVDVKVKARTGSAPLTGNSVQVTSLPSTPAGSNVIGSVGINGSIPPGTNNIGDVDVASLPPLPAGTNNIGDVDVLSLPAIPTGTNIIGRVRNTGIIPVRQWGSWHTLRGERFIATTGYVQNTLNSSNETIALLRNPSGSNKWIILDQAEFGCTNNTRFSRYGGGTITLNVATSAKRPIGQSDGGTGATPVAELFTGGNTSPQFTVTTPGTLRKVATMLAYETYQILTIGGTAIIRPGQQAYWTVDEAPGGGSGNFFTFIDFEWIEITETEGLALVTAAQAYSEL